MKEKKKWCKCIPLTSQELVKSKKEVMAVIGYIIDCYEDYKIHLNTSDNSKAKENTLDQYNDFYEWLQGQVRTL